MASARQGSVVASQSMLVVNDHLAKAEHFRSRGLRCLRPSISKHICVDLSPESMPTKTLVLLGDLFHSSLNAWEDFELWLKTRKRPGWTQASWCVATTTRPTTWSRSDGPGGGPVGKARPGAHARARRRDSQEHPDSLCGHVHPAAVMRGVGRQSERVPVRPIVDRVRGGYR